MKIKYLMIGMIAVTYLTACVDDSNHEEDESHIEKFLSLCDCIELGKNSNFDVCKELFEDMSDEDVVNTLKACRGESDYEENEVKKEKSLTVCDCIELGEKMYEEIQEIDMTDDDAEDKMKAIEEKYKSDIQACNKMGKDMGDEDVAKAIEDC